MDERVKELSDKTFEKNWKVKTQIMAMQEASRRRDKELVGINIVDVLCDNCGD